jgi:1-acyl-sn-glycerol-3-phosphate acyltransferase
LRGYHRLQIHGRKNLPAQGPFVLVANHASHLDVLVLASALPVRMRPDVFPIAAGDTFFKSPLMAVTSALFINALPIWRDGAVGHALADLRARLASGLCVFLIFPEGTRSRDGAMGAFKAGLGMLVAGTAVPVVPCRIRGAFEALPRGRRFPRPCPIQLTIGQPLRFADVANDRDGWASIARRVETAVADGGGKREGGRGKAEG